MEAIKLIFDYRGIVSFEHGTKKVYVHSTVEGDNEIIKIFYYDSKFDNSRVPACCKTPSKCKSIKSAERLINRFFAED